MSPGRLIKYLPERGQPTAPARLHVERGLLPHEYPSECVSSLNYDPEEQVLTVEFQKRGTYIYRGFPVTEWLLFNDATSRGVYFNLYVRDRYDYERVA